MKTLCAVTLLVLFCGAPASAYRGAPWTAVASTGTIDEAGLGIYAAGAATVGYLAGSPSTAQIVARFNVIQNYGQFSTTVAGWNTLELGYFDNAAGSSVSATLWEVALSTGAQTDLCTVTSIDNATPTTKVCYFLSTPLDFSSNVYFIAVKINRDNAILQPFFYSLRIFD